MERRNNSRRGDEFCCPASGPGLPGEAWRQRSIDRFDRLASGEDPWDPWNPSRGGGVYRFFTPSVFGSAGLNRQKKEDLQVQPLHHVARSHYYWTAVSNKKNLDWLTGWYPLSFPHPSSSRYKQGTTLPTSKANGGMKNVHMQHGNTTAANPSPSR